MSHTPRPETGAARRNRKSRNPAAAARSARARLNRKTLGRPEKRHVDVALADAVREIALERGLTTADGYLTRDAIARSPVLASVVARAMKLLTRSFDKEQVEAVVRNRFARPADATDTPATEGLVG